MKTVITDPALIAAFTGRLAAWIHEQSRGQCKEFAHLLSPLELAELSLCRGSCHAELEKRAPAPKAFPRL